MFISDKKMLELRDILKAKGIIRFDTEFCEAIGILKQNLYQIENPEKAKRVQHFTPQHIENAGNRFGVDMNFIFGFSPNAFVSNRILNKSKSTKTSTSVKKKQQKTEI